MRNEFNFRWENPVRIRSCQYLNNVVEQDHRRIKSRVQPMLGFKKFYNARRAIIGIEFRPQASQGSVPPRLHLIAIFKLQQNVRPYGANREFSAVMYRVLAVWRQMAIINRGPTQVH